MNHFRGAWFGAQWWSAYWLAGQRTPPQQDDLLIVRNRPLLVCMGRMMNR